MEPCGSLVYLFLCNTFLLGLLDFEIRMRQVVIVFGSLLEGKRAAGMTHLIDKSAGKYQFARLSPNFLKRRSDDLPN